MSIKHVCLGYLSWRPMSGYDLKKVIADSEVLSWTANNNQIYKALVTLHQEGWVSKSVEEQDGAPNRHVYTITSLGRDALKRWVMTEPAAPHSNTSFLNQIMWSDLLSTDEIAVQLERYIQSVGEKLFFLRVQADQRPNMPERTSRESLIWEKIYQRWVAQYELELKWARHLQETLQTL